MEIAVTIVITLICLFVLFYCVMRIASSIFLEAKYRAALVGSHSENVGEPFRGALYVSALLVYIYQSAYDAEHGMRWTFKKIFRTDWGPYCRAAESLHSALNGDLLVESLAAVLSRAPLDTEILTLVFDAITQAEFVWDDKERGTKPSVYLACLLNYKVEDSELAKAYEVLGLSPKASLVEVKAAHRKLAAKYHPDKGGACFSENVGTLFDNDSITNSGTKNGAETKKISESDESEIFMRIQKAYELIETARK